MASSVASSSRLPAYQSGAQDVISRIASLSSLPIDHPAHKRLLSSISLSSESISLWANTQAGIITCPQTMSNGQTDLEGWGREAGYLLIVATTRRKIGHISVKLVSRQSLEFPQDNGRREEDEVFCREALLQDDGSGGVWLEKGLNTFAFSLNLPPDMCITVDEHAARLYQHVVATAVGSAKGLFGKDLTVSEKVYSMSVPADEEDLIFRHHAADFHDSLGPCSFEVSSSLFTVAGAVFFSLVLASPPPTLRVYAFRASFNHTHELTSFRDPSKSTALHKTTNLFEAGWRGPFNNRALGQLVGDGRDAQVALFDAAKAGPDGFTLEEVARVPPDYLMPPGNRAVRPSTYPGTKTCIRTSCELVVEVFFTISSSTSSSPPKLQVAQLLKKPVFLNSCGCMPGRLALPDYAVEPERFEPLKVRIPCRCDETDEDIIEAEWKHVRASRAAAAAGGGQEEARDDPKGRKVGEIRDRG